MFWSFSSGGIVANKRGGFCGAGFEQSLRICIGFVAISEWSTKIQKESERYWHQKVIVHAICPMCWMVRWWGRVHNKIGSLWSWDEDSMIAMKATPKLVETLFQSIPSCIPRSNLWMGRIYATNLPEPWKPVISVGQELPHHKIHQTIKSFNWFT